MMRLLCVFISLLLLACGLPARADTPVALLTGFNGTVNFTGTEVVLRTNSNYDPCSIVKTGTVLQASLSGIPSGATVLSAQLYWAGSGATPDYTVKFDGNTITAPLAPKDKVTRQYLSKVTISNTVYTYFSGAADVTGIVKQKGNGTYSFSDLTIDNGLPWCAVQAVVGGFALVVVYSHPNEPFRKLNLYEGFQSFRNNSLTLNLTDFRIPDPLPANVTGRIGHITWEGDATLSQGGEDLLFNGYEMVDTYPFPFNWFWFNPPGNQFNSASNVVWDPYSYGIDFDVYTLRSPVIQPGQRSATTTYRSGQDLVILGAEIVALPYVPSADLALAMTRSGDLTVGSQSSYTLTVTNLGVDDETGPVTVVDTLPAGLTLDAASGTGWTCTSVKGVASTVVTCTQPGPVKPAATMSPIVIKVTPSAAGNYTNSATVSGKTTDDNSANNSATDTAAAKSAATVNYVLTREACTPGAAIVSADDAAGCHLFNGPVWAADSATVLYITNVATVNGQLQAAAKGASDFPLTADFKFTCATSTTTAITYAKVAFTCNSASWVSVSAKIRAGQASAVVNDTANSALAFYYADVGRMSVTMQVGTAVGATTNFVSRPSYLGFDSIVRASDGYADRDGVAASGWAKPDIGFAKSGEQFVMRLCAYMANKVCAPSFGKEAESSGFQFALDRFAVNLSGAPRTPIASGTTSGTTDPLNVDALVADAWVQDQAFTASGNLYIAKARWFEAGLLGLAAALDDYLDTGEVNAANRNQSGRMVDGARVVGRFYPDHFVTSAVRKLDCLPPMNCPTAPDVEVEGAVYSMQPFDFGIKAYALPRPDGSQPPLKLFQNLVIDAAKPRLLVLSASKAPNLAAAPDTGRFDADPAAQLDTPAAANDYPDQQGKLTWRLGDKYDPAKRTVNTWGAPTAVYLRASMKEFRGTGSGSAYTEELITSQTPAGAAAGTRYEDGLVVVAGRLYVANVFGSDLLRLPVPLAAQYWSGSAWLSSSKDDNKVASSLKPVSCLRAFAQNLASGACKANALTVAGSVPVPLKAGRGNLVLQAPARGTQGSVDFTVDSLDAPWLPSTQARATFGLYRSPLIYLREVY